MNVPLHAIIIILGGHWVGDYLLQFNSMADQKGESFKWLAIHVLLYTVVILVFAFILFSWNEAIKFSLINGGFHFVTDLVTSRFSARFRSNPRIYYPIIGFDQFIHTVTLIATMQYVTLSTQR